MASENDKSKKIYTLQQLSISIKNALETSSGNRMYWIKAEISDLKFSTSGHAYIELVEHANGAKVAVMQATIWQNKLEQLKESLSTDFDNVLKNGSEIVFIATINFHQIFGLKLFIHDIDISYTIGSLERKKEITIRRLRQEGLFEKNKK